MDLPKATRRDRASGPDAAASDAGGVEADGDEDMTLSQRARRLEAAVARSMNDLAGERTRAPGGQVDDITAAIDDELRNTRG